MASQDLAHLKAANPLEDVAREYGITFDPKGRGPFAERHNNGDANPSLHLDRNHGRLGCESQDCFGGPVDVIGLVMKMNGIGFKAACQKLAQPRAGTRVCEVGPCGTLQRGRLEAEATAQRLRPVAEGGRR